MGEQEKSVNEELNELRYKVMTLENQNATLTLMHQLDIAELALRRRQVEALEDEKNKPEENTGYSGRRRQGLERRGNGRNKKR